MVGVTGGGLGRLMQRPAQQLVACRGRCPPRSPDACGCRYGRLDLPLLDELGHVEIDPRSVELLHVQLHVRLQDGGACRF
ncbi:MAG: hypothetical protein ACXV5Q_05940 [Frankiaceae bacterium]